MWGYPRWGYWYHPGWGWWYYPWVGGWYYPGYWGWYYPVFGFSVLLYTEKQDRPYVVVANKKAPKATWFAVYEQAAGSDKKDAIFQQTEAAREIKKGKNLRIYLDGRTENEVLVFANNPDALKTTLTAAEVEKLSALELGNIDTVKGKKQRGKLATETDTSASTASNVEKFHKQVNKRKKEFKTMEEKAKRVDLRKYADKTNKSEKTQEE